MYLFCTVVMGALALKAAGCEMVRVEICSVFLLLVFAFTRSGSRTWSG